MTTAETIEDDLVRFLEARTQAPVRPDVDLFESGTITSLFAMQLVVRLEESYDIAITGPDLMLENFRTVRKMIDLVLRLRQVAAGSTGG